MKFAVTGLPRSRTKWASLFLSTPETPCLHDVIPPAIPHLSDNVALSDPSILFVWETLPEDMPIAYIHRPLNEVIASANAFGIATSAIMDMHKRAAHMITERDVLVLSFNDLEASALWKHCYGTEVSSKYIQVYTDMNITQKSIEQLRRAA